MVFLRVGHIFLSQAKVNISQLVVTGYIVPHVCKYLAGRPKLLLHRPLLDGSPCGFHNSVMDALGKYLEERNGIGDALDISGDVHPTVELAPLAPGGGILLVDCGG